ncbi:uncharacterized protein N7482_007416 [Penicillium canariense]|uniref:Uncharacterized protein n=1 Tax=Penicillium canariense TaxID=189055 RepID=A0A9W9LJ32_9EURO|nr:uncharacterized protein N7482_007416 [Penicillium canariense]KAJ5160412.1 hypothetical protein N7482_007416 [Penicillium canariense]
MPPTAPTIILLGTCDTKLGELLYTKAQIQRHSPCHAYIMDIGHNPVSHPDIMFSQEIYISHSASLPGPTVEIKDLDRTEYIDALAPYASAMVSTLYSENKIHGVLGLGGSCGTALAARIMRDALPVGFPKLIVSTMASGDVSPYIGETDITMMYSVVDIAGRNRLLERVLMNAAGAIAGMAKGCFEDQASTSTSTAAAPTKEDGPRIGITMFGVTTPAATKAREHLEAILPSCEVYIFHATGSGGRAMERLISEGQLDAVLDLTTTEIADEVVGGVLSAGPTRLCAATRRNIPRVVSVGACDMVNFGTADSIPAAFASATGQHERLFHQHNPTVTLMRTKEEECIRIARLIAENLLGGNAAGERDATSRTRVILPTGGVSLLDTPEQPFWGPAADEALFFTLEDRLRGSGISVTRDSHDINDPRFAIAAADMLIHLINGH